MSGAMKSGLICGLIAIVLTIGVSFIPAIGALCCGPLSGVLIGGIAGYLGVRWSDANAGVGQGALAGTISGVGSLIGTIIFFIIAIGMVQSMPGFQEMLEESVRQQQPDAQLTGQDLQAMLGIVGPAMGFCFGLLSLLFSLGGGALGGMFAVRNRTSELPPAAPVG